MTTNVPIEATALRVSAETMRNKKLRVEGRRGLAENSTGVNGFFRNVALALSSLLLALGMGACSKTTTTASGVHPWTRPGVFRYAENEDARGLNPVLFTSAPTLDLSMFIYSWSVRYNAQGQPVPDALREIPTIANGDVSKDGLTLKYKLRTNIKWQDGVQLTCRDLRFTWQYVMDPHTNIASTDGFSSIGSIDCPNPYMAVIHLKKPYAPFLQTIFGPNGNAPILPEHILVKYMDGKGGQNTAPYNAMPIGSGPFKVVEWQRGTVVRLVANPNFYLGKPKLNEVDFYTVPDNNTLLTEVQTHAIDMLVRGDDMDWPRYSAVAASANSGLRAIQVDSFIYRHIDFNLHNPILADVQVHRALAYATDRNEIIQKIFHGAAFPSDSPEHPALSWGYTNDTVKYPFDPAKARQLLDADGWKVSSDGVRVKGGKRLEFDLSTLSEAAVDKAIQLLVQRQWRDVGVQVDVKNYTTPEFFENGSAGILEGGHYDAAIFAWAGAADPDLNALYSANNMAPRGQNSLFWDNATATAALADALSTVNQARRKRDYVIFQQQLALDVPTIVICFLKQPYVYNTDLKGFDPSPVISAFWDPWNYSMP
jgi:peptide/nickel transport system substrate-binding protein